MLAVRGSDPASEVSLHRAAHSELAVYKECSLQTLVWPARRGEGGRGEGGGGDQLPAKVISEKSIGEIKKKARSRNSKTDGIFLLCTSLFPF